MPEPKATKIDHETKVGDATLRDDYAWMRDKNWPKEVKEEVILTHLQDENKYTESFFKSTSEMQNGLYNEIKGRIKLTDQSAYVKVDNYYYYTRTEEDKGYPIYCRRFGSLEAPEEIILDANKIAEGKKFAKVSEVSVDPTHSKLVYNVDFSGDEKYTIQVINLENGEHLPDKIDNVCKIENTCGDIVWSKNSLGFFYTPVNADSRTDAVFYHVLGTDSNNDKKIFEEKNPEYDVGIYESNSRDYLFISVSGHSDSEQYVLDLSSDDLKTQIVQARKAGVKYFTEHNGDYLYMMTNDAGQNFRITRAELKALDSWSEYIPLDKEKPLDDFDITNNFLILNYKSKGLPFIKVLHLKDGSAQVVAFQDESYSAKGYSTNFVEDDLRADYSSLARPKTTYTYDFVKNKTTILKETEIPTGHHPADYEVRRIWANNNGVKVPVSLVYKKSLFKHDGTNPLYLYGYGSYGITVEPAFKQSILSLVDRGFVYAIAHVRGGDDMGYSWYLDAKFLKKKNTFEDFIACTEELIKEKYTSKGNIVIMGGSAGGMLIGAALNMHPDLYKAAVAHVPFVDVLNTMLDETLPLTPGEYNEWGNPKEKDYFEYIKSYSPYDNVSEQAYPAIFATVGISDPRVGYWEAAKWIAKLRSVKTDENVALLKTNLDAGHQGASDRFEYIKEVAEEYAFIMKIFNVQM